jgi:phosphoribosylaminoimidazolecarboxamide formyltransferase/IMP cyclohydrolase
MSFTNYLDVDAAWKLCNVIKGSVSIVKHGIPTGVAHSRDLASAYRSAFACDSISAFGGVVAVSAHVDEMCALEITKNFTEVVAAPSYTEAALILFSSKSNLRVIKIRESQPTPWEFRAIEGGYLVQERNLFTENDSATSWKLVAGKACNSSQLKDLEFAWRIAALSRSNAIVVAKDQATVGIGAGNVNRLDAARSAVLRAQPDLLQGSVAASDAFFPFPDALEILIASGVSAVVQPGGSVNDFDVIAAAQAAGITMYTSGIRHFSH